jgi:DNA-directed RNA polymerase subunit beta'
MIDPPKKREILEQADKKVFKIRERWTKGEITRDERKQGEVDVWTKATEDVTDRSVTEVRINCSPMVNSTLFYMMAFSGARGNHAADPSAGKQCAVSCRIHAATFLPSRLNPTSAKV